MSDGPASEDDQTNAPVTDKMVGKPAAGERAASLKAITGPIQFFALVVLAVRAILDGSGTASNIWGKLSGSQLFSVFEIMAGLLALMAPVVAGIAIWRPEVLSLEIAEALRKADEAKRTATNTAELLGSQEFRHAVADALEAREAPRKQSNRQLSSGGNE